MLALGATLLGFAVIAGLGVPLIGRLVDRQLHKGVAGAPLDKRVKHALVEATQFEPLDLGPDLIHWPSEQGRAPYVEKLQWPSTHWEDDAFGRKNATAAGATSRAQSEETRRKQVAQRRSATQPVGATRRAPKQEPKRKATAPRRVKLRARQDPARPARPTPEDVGALVRKKGLAGAVRHLMDTHNMTLEEVTALMVQRDS